MSHIILEMCTADIDCTNGNSCKSNSCACGTTGPACTDEEVCDVANSVCKCGTSDTCDTTENPYCFISNAATNEKQCGKKIEIYLTLQTLVFFVL